MYAASVHFVTSSTLGDVIHVGPADVFDLRRHRYSLLSPTVHAGSVYYLA